MSEQSASSGASIRERYKRAAAFLPEPLGKHLRNTDVEPRWIPDRDMFWYLRETERGHEFVLVDAGTGRTELAFDHRVLANSLTEATGAFNDPASLPFRHVTLGDGLIRFTTHGADWEFDPDNGTCRQSAQNGTARHELISPDWMHVAFVRQDNLWVRERRSGKERQLTQDGRAGWSYAKSPDCNTATLSNRIAGVDLPPVALWSPDSRSLVTHVLDETHVPLLHYLQSVPKTGIRPLVHSLHSAFPGDKEVPLQRPVIVDLGTGRVTALDMDPIVAGQVSSIELMNVWWGEDSGLVFLIDVARDFKSAKLIVADADTGKTRVILEDSAETFLELNHGAVHDSPLVRILNGGADVIWFSQRDGWGHLYLYDGQTGSLKNRITSGEMLVRAIHHVDPRRQTVYFSANGPAVAEDPYHRALFRVALDGSDLQRLTPQDADYHVAAEGPVRTREFRSRTTPAPTSGVSGSGRYFVATASRIDMPPTTALYRADGAKISVVETANIGAALDLGWQPPDPFCVLAADGVTEIHGALWLPTDYDPGLKYPILDFCYPGPQKIQTPKRCFSKAERAPYCLSQAMAELGMIVVTIDGRGTPFRSKSYHDEAYLTQDNPGNIDDHIAAIRQLAQTTGSIDLERVGIMGHSGGAFAAAKAILRHHEFFSVAVCSSGNYDYRGYNFHWGEKYMGPLEVHANGETNYDALDCTRDAGNLKGKLLLGYGDMDDNVHCFQSIRFIASLIEANKDFEQVVLPNSNHESIMTHPYWLRRVMDFLTRNLVGAVPPKEIDLCPHDCIKF